MSNALGSHGATVAMELDPAGSAGTFTVIGELNSDIVPPGLSRTPTEATPHQDTIDSHVTGVLRRTPMTFGVNWIYNNGQHDQTTGLIDAIHTQETRGWRFRGAGWATPNEDEWIMSGEVTNITFSNPVREGVRTAEVEVVVSGVMKIDGTTIGTVG